MSRQRHLYGPARHRRRCRWDGPELMQLKEPAGRGGDLGCWGRERLQEVICSPASWGGGRLLTG